jgi:hypothetical protein
MISLAYGIDCIAINALLWDGHLRAASFAAKRRTADWREFVTLLIE